MNTAKIHKQISRLRKELDALEKAIADKPVKLSYVKPVNRKAYEMALDEQVKGNRGPIREYMKNYRIPTQEGRR